MGKNCKTPEGVVTARSSCGEFTFDVRTGMVRDVQLELDEFGSKPVRVDVPDFVRWLGFPVDRDVDVLAIGYWMENGKYEPACDDWRKEYKAMRIEDADYDFGYISEEEQSQKEEGIRNLAAAEGVSCLKNY